MWSRGHRLLPKGPGALTRWKPATSTSVRSRPSDITSTPVSLLTGVPPADAPEDEGPTVEELIAAAEARGREEGRLEAEAALAAERERLAQTVADIAGLRRRILEAAEHEVMQVASGMARRILHRELQLDPDILLAMARVALGRLGDQAAATVTLHPQDLAALTTTTSLGAGLIVDADPALPKGGCRIRAEQGEIDLGLDAQLGELSRLLLGETPGVDTVKLH